MTVLSNQQIRDLWTRNGGSPQLAAVMAAIAQAESSGHTDVINDNPSTGDYSVGLWQINYFRGLLGPRSQRYGSPAQLQANPDLQARAAVDLAANGNGLGNWSTYSSGSYRQYLNGDPSQGGGNSSVGDLSSQPLPAGVGGSDIQETCLIKAPKASFLGFDAGGGCLLGTGPARAILGSVILVSGGVLFLLGVTAIVANGLAGSKAGSRAGSANSSLRQSTTDRQLDRSLDREIDKGAARAASGGPPTKPKYPSHKAVELDDGSTF